MWLVNNSYINEQLIIINIIGARVDIEDKEINTPLHVAARHGHASVVKTLLAYGAQMFRYV